MEIIVNRLYGSKLCTRLSILCVRCARINRVFGPTKCTGKEAKNPDTQKIPYFFDNKHHNEVATYSKLTTMRPICIRILFMESTILNKDVQKLSNRSTK